MRFIKKILPLVASLLAMSGCTKADVLNIIIPSTGYTVHKDIAYGDKPRQKLDVYVPDKPDASGTVVVFFYGGSWQKGYKELYKFVGQAFTSKGYITVVVDYSVYPDAYFPDFLNDGAKSLAWVQKNISNYGADPKHMYVSGHSAGGYIAVMLALNEEYLKEAGGSSKWIKGGIGISGPYDFLPFTDPKIKAIFSTSEDELTQPIHFARKGAPPLLLITAEHDSEVGAKNTVNLSRKLREMQSPVEVKTYPDVGHVGIVLSLAHGFRSKAPMLDDIDAFIRSTNASK